MQLVHRTDEYRTVGVFLEVAKELLRQVAPEQFSIRSYSLGLDLIDGARAIMNFHVPTESATVHSKDFLQDAQRFARDYEKRTKHEVTVRRNYDRKEETSQGQGDSE